MTGTKIVLDNAVISWLAKNKEAVETFPFLKKAAGKSGCCNKSEAVLDYSFIKQAVMNLPEADLGKLKNFLKVDQIEIYPSLYGKPIIK